MRRATNTVRRGGLGEGGAVMVEAALVLPILLVIFLALVEFTDAFSVRRRVEAVASSVADLVAQSASISSANLNDVIGIGEVMMRPYADEPLGVRVGSIGLNEEGEAIVQWSHGSAKLAARVPGEAISVPAGLIDGTTTMILAETSYTFVPAVGTYLLSGVTFTVEAFYRPRLGIAVEKLD